MPETKTYEVLRVFKDRETGSRFTAGSHYKTADLKRAEMLQSRGFIGDEIKPEPANEPVTEPATKGNKKGDSSKKIEEPAKTEDKPEDEPEAGE